MKDFLHNIKKHKNKIIYCTIALVLFLVFLNFNPLFVYVPNCDNGEVTCVQYDEYNNETRLTQKMSAEDTEIIKEIFRDNRKLYYDSPACGFYGHSIRLGNQEFYPACDTCSIIMYKTKYFNVSEKEIDQIHKIMKKYGANFPCV